MQFTTFLMIHGVTMVMAIIPWGMIPYGNIPLQKMGVGVQAFGLIAMLTNMSIFFLAQ